MYSRGSYYPLFFVPKIKVSNPKIKRGAPITYGIFMLEIIIVYKKFIKALHYMVLRCLVERVSVQA